jgi:predicted nucleotidyltransferase
MYVGHPQFIDDLARQLHREPAVEFAVVFGSVATDKTHPSSDLDIAVKFSETLSSQERFQKRCLLSSSLQQSGQPFVDVSDMAELPLPIAHDAVNGTLLCGDEQAFQQFKTTIEAEFEEHQAELQHHHHDVIARIAERGLHG